MTPNDANRREEATEQSQHPETARPAQVDTGMTRRTFLKGWGAAAAGGTAATSAFLASGGTANAQNTSSVDDLFSGTVGESDEVEESKATDTVATFQDPLPQIVLEVAQYLGLRGTAYGLSGINVNRVQTNAINKPAARMETLEANALDPDPALTPPSTQNLTAALARLEAADLNAIRRARNIQNVSTDLAILVDWVIWGFTRGNVQVGHPFVNAAGLLPRVMMAIADFGIILKQRADRATHANALADKDIEGVQSELDRNAAATANVIETANTQDAAARTAQEQTDQADRENQERLDQRRERARQLRRERRERRRTQDTESAAVLAERQLLVFTNRRTNLATLAPGDIDDPNMYVSLPHPDGQVVTMDLERARVLIRQAGGHPTG